MVNDNDDRPEVSLLFAVAAGTHLAQRNFCENPKFMRNYSS
jgi:hypothetical protein